MDRACDAGAGVGVSASRGPAGEALPGLRNHEKAYQNFGFIILLMSGLLESPECHPGHPEDCKEGPGTI